VTDAAKEVVVRRKKTMTTTLDFISELPVPLAYFPFLGGFGTLAKLNWMRASARSHIATYATVIVIPAGAVKVVPAVSMRKVIVCPAVILANVVTVRVPSVE
jgi:hypothetical protein